jgi:hypothetical protein
MNQVVVGPRIALCDFWRGVCQMELDRPPAAATEIDEERPFPRAEHVALMRLTVQQLVADPSPAEHGRQITECVAEELRSASRSSEGNPRLRSSSAQMATRSARCSASRSISRKLASGERIGIVGWRDRCSLRVSDAPH